MSRVNVQENKVYLNRELRPQKGETADKGYERGLPSGPDIHDQEIESHEHREHFQEGEGDIAITVEAGEELGEISVCVQFEGQIVGASKHLADACVAAQNDLIQDSAGWLRDILAEFDTEWTAEMAAVPCPVADGQLDVHRAALVLSGVKVETPAVSPSRKVKTTVQVISETNRG